MWPILRLFMNIALLRSGPEAIPAVRVFFVLVFLANLAVNLFVLTVDTRLTTMGLVVLFTAMYALLMGTVYGLLWFKERLQLYQQTLTAFFGVDILIKGLLLPLVLIHGKLDEGDNMRGTIEMGILALTIWAFLIEGFIYQKAARVSIFLGIIIAVVTTGLVYKVEYELFAAQIAQTHSLILEQGQ